MSRAYVQSKKKKWIGSFSSGDVQNQNIVQILDWTVRFTVGPLCALLCICAKTSLYSRENFN